MTYNNVPVNFVYANRNTRLAYAIFGAPVPGGWKRINPASADGVTNVLTLLGQARANNRRVNVNITGNQINWVILR